MVVRLPSIMLVRVASLTEHLLSTVTNFRTYRNPVPRSRQTTASQHYDHLHNFVTQKSFPNDVCP